MQAGAGVGGLPILQLHLHSNVTLFLVLEIPDKATVKHVTNSDGNKSNNSLNIIEVTIPGKKKEFTLCLGELLGAYC